MGPGPLCPFVGKDARVLSSSDLLLSVGELEFSGALGFPPPENPMQKGLSLGAVGPGRHLGRQAQLLFPASFLPFLLLPHPL